MAAITGPNNVSHNATIALTVATPGGVWSSSNSALGSVDGIGNVTGAGTSGTVTISYRLSYAGGGCSAFATKAIVVHTPAPHSHTITTSVGTTVELADEVAGGEWACRDENVATVDGSGTVTAIAEGSVNITNTVTGTEGTIVTITMVQICAAAIKVSIVPNPNKGTFIVRGSLGTKEDAMVSIEISDMLGQVVYKNSTIAAGGMISEHVLLNSNFANGIYLLNVRSKQGDKVLHFVIEN